MSETTSPWLRDLLARHRLLAVLRGPDPGTLVDCAHVLADAGLRVAEVSMTSTDAAQVLRRCAAALGDRLVLGAGTVLSAADADASLAAGAQFLVTPAASAGATAGVRRGAAVLAGAFTPGEVWAAHEAGAAAVKVFPASLGGPSYVHALRDPFPAVPLVPVGGVGAADAPAYLAAGAVAVGVGSPLLGDAATGGDLGALAGRARRFLEAVA